MPRKMTHEEAMEAGRNLPVSIWLDQKGRPLRSRDEWERLPRWRRIRDVLLGRDPLKEPDWSKFL